MTVTVRGGGGVGSNNTAPSSSNNSDPAIISSSMTSGTSSSVMTPDLGYDTSVESPLISTVPTVGSGVTSSLGVPTTTLPISNNTISPVNSLVVSDPVSSSSSLSEANTIIDGQDVDANEQGDQSGVGDPSDEAKFPLPELNRLDDMINRPRWVIPVLPKGELELLLDASIALAKRGVDHLCEPCQRFYREGLTISFTKILTDEAVSGWKIEIHRCILSNCEKLIELIALKLPHDCLPLLELMAIVFNPNNKFHSYTSNRIESNSSTIPVNGEVFAKSPDSRVSRGWLVDLINKFGRLDGFRMILDRVSKGVNTLTVPLISALIRPFGYCHELLTVESIEKYFMPIFTTVTSFLEDLTDEELKKESKNESRNDALSGIIKSLKNLASRVPGNEDLIKELEVFRLKMILKLLQISSFNGKMNALNEVNKVITNVSFYTNRHVSSSVTGPTIGSGGSNDDEEFLTAERMAEWIKENNVLKIVLRDSLHQPQYVEKLEKIIRFVIKEKTLTLEDLDDLWAAQSGKHEAIVKNVHDLLAKLAWDFSPEQLDHLFECFQFSWKDAPKKQREKLLELIRRLAEDDKDGVMAHKVLNLLWNLAHNDDVPNDIMDQALAAHVKILDYSCSQDRDTQKSDWLEKCIGELKKENGDWVLPALKQMREICCLYTEAPPNGFTATSTVTNSTTTSTTGTGPRSTVTTTSSSHLNYRHEVINRLQNDHALVILISENLSTYMNRSRKLARDNPHLNPHEIHPGSRFSHIQEVQERLNFLRFVLKDGQLWLCAPQAKQIWKCLAESAVYEEDREACFKWFSLLMTEEPDLDPEYNKNFFENNILQFDPSLITESGMECFERFFKEVNVKEGKMIAKRRNFLTEDLELIGTEYLWRVILNASDDVSLRGIELLKETFTNLGPQLSSSRVAIHEDFITSCIDRLRAAFDTVAILLNDPSAETKIKHESIRMTRVLKVLHEYIHQCDTDFGEERTILPMSRAFRGVQLQLTIRFPNQGRQMEDLDIWTHSNDTLHSIRRQILTKVKANNANMKVDLYVNGELIDASDKKLVSQLPIKDRMVLTGKLYQVNANMPSSPDSSSDSSSGSPANPCADGSTNVEAENCLPGVIMSRQHCHAQFFFQISDLGMQLDSRPLIDNALAILKIMPADEETIRILKATSSPRRQEECDLQMDQEHSLLSSLSRFDSLFLKSSPTEVAYTLGVIYSLLMPAQNPLSEDAQEFQVSFIESGAGFKVVELLTRNNFLSKSDDLTRICTFLVVLKISKLVLVTMAHLTVLSSDSTKGDDSSSAMIHQGLYQIPNPTADCMIRDVALKVAKIVNSSSLDPSLNPSLNPSLDPSLDCKQMMKKCVIMRESISAVIMVAWSASTGLESSLSAPIGTIRSALRSQSEGIYQIYLTCKEALQVLSVMFMLQPEILDEKFQRSEEFKMFIIDLLLICPEDLIRETALEQFTLIAMKCSRGENVLIEFIQLLYEHLYTTVSEYYETSSEFFQLFCSLLNFSSVTRVPLPLTQDLLEKEIELIQNVRTKFVKNGLIEEIELEGHLGITREIVSLLSPEMKHSVGCDREGRWVRNKDSTILGMVKLLIDEFIFPASRAIVLMEKKKSPHVEEINPLCSSPATLSAAFDVLVALCTNCLPNLQVVAQTLIEMFYSDETESLVEWEYLPPVGPRASRGFVGLKNAGATCYMNSVLQQLYMIPEIREGILQVDGAINDPSEDFSSDDRPDVGVSVMADMSDEEKGTGGEESRKEYNIGVLKYVQAIFGHLALSKLQYYVPRGFWKHFKLQGEPINLREQHDALEFFNSLVDSLDEALKSLNHSPIMTQVLGGSFADQKICKDCPHRYSREESFTTLNIDIRNHSNLLDSLEQYVKGDLLEGANAYHCDKCDRKVDTVKRLCINKLPPVLAIQLKRFDYDWERECAIKFNDYFEFPRILDMNPYTVRGLAQIEGEVIEEDLDSSPSSSCTKYDLCGIVVHSGQASGGHYYSYILYKHADGSKKWYKFDDGDVTECKLEEDEEMRNQCYGGEYMGEVFDHMLKRMSCRRQKRWWNAYILIYRRIDSEVSDVSLRLNELTIMESKTIEGENLIKLPPAIQRSVQNQNIKFMHTKNQFSIEYFQFMKKLLQNNGQIVLNACHGKENSGPGKGLIHDIAMTCVQLGSKFLFTTCFHTKKSLRGPAVDWYDVMSCHFRSDHHVRAWFVHNMLFLHPYRFCDYLLESPSADVRNAFYKMILFICHFALQDGNRQVSLPSSTGSLTIIESGIGMSDKILLHILGLIRKEVAEHSRHLNQYFLLFANYAGIGSSERSQLLRLNVAQIFVSVALDDGPGPPIKYQYADLSKLYQVVSILVRSCDLTSRCSPSHQGASVLKNPFGEEPENVPLHTLPPQVADALFARNSYIKKVLEDANSSEETVKMFKYCSWENPSFSSMILTEILWQIAYSYSYELRPHLEILLQLLMMEDSWQEHRIHNALRGIQEDKEGLFDTIQRNKSHYQKRAYQCIKCLVNLFSNCRIAYEIMLNNGELKSRWSSSVSWLHEELERRPFAAGSQYTYNWSPPAQSNETSNGYYLERSQSARITLTKAVELVPDEETRTGDEVEMEQEMSEGNDSPPPGSFPVSPSANQAPTTSPVPTAPSPNPPSEDHSSPFSLSSKDRRLDRTERSAGTFDPRNSGRKGARPQIPSTTTRPPKNPDGSSD